MLGNILLISVGINSESISIKQFVVEPLCASRQALHSTLTTK
jgi:hypothetical protein